MLHTHSLKAEERGTTGTGSARAFRKRDMIPAIIYGAGKEEILFAVPKKEMTLQYHKQGFLSRVFDIEVGKKSYRALPKSIQTHPVTDNIVHIDFIHINENEKMKVTVTLHFINDQKCPGIKQGGVLNVARHELEVYCLPSNIPESIEIDIAEVELGGSIHVSDIKLPKDVETKVDMGMTIATVAAGKVMAEDKEDGAEAEAESKTVETK
jgi:large subunit ribosomal protein L25|tara:strand:+ start:157 stop:786 length:630 start_codon:yes stop_codon:yes gene_type:complete